MKTRTLLIITAMFATSLSCDLIAEDAVTKATVKTEKPIAEKPIDPEARKILEGLEVSGGETKSLQSPITLTTLDNTTGDKRIQTGTLSYDKLKKDAPTRFRLEFEFIFKGRKMKKSRDEVDYSFNGRWFTIRKHRAKQMVSVQIAPKGKAANALQIGKGPLTIPIGQKVEDVTKIFDVSVDPPKDRKPSTGPEDTKYIRLLRKKKGSVDIAELEIWVNKDSLPVKVISYEGPRPGNIVKIKTYTLSDIKTDIKFDDEFFRPPAKPSWSIDVRNLPKKPAKEDDKKPAK